MIRIILIKIYFIIFLCVGTVHAAPPSLPAPDPGLDEHIFYGANPPGSTQSPILVFVHGLRGTASDWWINTTGAQNDMYEFAYNNGYRTAFISLSPDNSRNDEPIAFNAEVFSDALPKIVARFGGKKVYLICHSKGGLDVQAAMLDPNVSELVKAVFNIATPNTGTELADWAFRPGNRLAQLLGLVTPGVEALQTANVEAFRSQADPVLSKLNIPFYTLFGRTFRGHPITAITGRILRRLAPDEKNDGFVSESHYKLPVSYGIDLGEVAGNHFENDTGNVSFPSINSQIVGIELTSIDFKRIAANGFGDFSPEGHDDSRFNTWMWSMQWFKGHLYVGVGRAVQCATMATAAAQAGNDAFYPPIVGDCTEDSRDLPLAAEIWRLKPNNLGPGNNPVNWERVFKSPVNIPLSGGKFTARDTGFRGMTVFTESNGEEVLYVAGTTSSSAFDNDPLYQGTGFPPPRILRSVDGINFEPIPQDPGTFLGDIANTAPGIIKVRGFRSMVTYKNKLFVTGSDFRGVGVIFASDNPALGNDAWQQVSASAEDFPVWTLKVFNDFLYVTTGDRQISVGYGVYKTDAEGSAPYTYQPVVINGGYQSIEVLRSPDALSLQEFNGQLYIGSNRPTELIRINPDDSWDLVVGHPRNSPQGFKNPISGIGQWFGNYFNGHFWRMASFDGHLYMGTWDWSQSFRTIELLDSLFRPQYGTDVYRTKDGVHWSFVTKSGFGNPFNYGTRSFQSTPIGLFLGTAKPEGGGEIYLNQSNLDFDDDEDIDQNDVDVIISAFGDPSNGPDDPRDVNRDGEIDMDDADKLAIWCDKANCGIVTPEVNIQTPQNLRSGSVYVVGRNVVLNWDPVPGAVGYRVFRSEMRAVLDLLPPNGIEIPFTNFGITAVVPDDFVSGQFDSLCSQTGNQQTLLCLLNRFIQSLDETGVFLGLPLRYFPVASTATSFYSEPAPTSLQSTYFVMAVDAQGRMSNPSNLVGAPSFADPSTLSNCRGRSEIWSRAPGGSYNAHKVRRRDACNRTFPRLARHSIDRSKQNRRQNRNRSSEAKDENQTQPRSTSRFSEF